MSAPLALPFSPAHLRSLDARQRTEHCFLDAADRCRYWVDYHPGARGHANQLIGHFKYPPSLIALSRARRHGKQRAIDEIAAALHASADRAFVESATWVPVPPSIQAGEAGYDDRLHRALRAAFGNYDLDARDLLRQVRSTRPDHCAVRRQGLHALYGLIRLDAAALHLRPVRARIVLFDDLLTTGKHYKCCQLHLREALPDLPICGWFVARRVLPRAAAWIARDIGP